MTCRPGHHENTQARSFPKDSPLAATVHFRRHSAMSLLKFLAALVLLLGLGAATVWFYRHYPPSPVPHTAATAASGTVKLHTITIDLRGDANQHAADNGIHVHWLYTQTGIPALDAQIRHWLGARCPEGEKPATADSPETCARDFIRFCENNARGSPPDIPLRCTLEGGTQVAFNQSGLLSITHSLYTDTGGAHGMPDLGFLNIDLVTDKILARNDLLNIPDAQLQALVEQAARQLYNLGPEEPLRDAGFFENHIAPTRNIGIRRDGLLFGYQAYEIAPYAAGQPQILVPYAKLAPYIPSGSPLMRLLPAVISGRQYPT
jgi:hypothetical protein